MSKKPSQELFRGSRHSEDMDTTLERGRKDSGSDASSLASLLRDELDNPEAMARMQPFATVEKQNPLNPQNWPRRKKMIVAVTIAIYT